MNNKIDGKVIKFWTSGLKRDYKLSIEEVLKDMDKTMYKIFRRNMLFVDLMHGTDENKKMLEKFEKENKIE